MVNRKKQRYVMENMVRYDAGNVICLFVFVSLSAMNKTIYMTYHSNRQPLRQAPPPPSPCIAFVAKGLERCTA
jgi:hypothetical protein